MRLCLCKDINGCMHRDTNMCMCVCVHACTAYCVFQCVYVSACHHALMLVSSKTSWIICNEFIVWVRSYIHSMIFYAEKTSSLSINVPICTIETSHSRWSILESFGKKFSATALLVHGCIYHRFSQCFNIH